MVVEILPKQQEVGSTISDAINVALYILKVDPSHWSTFARISTFDRDSFESKLAEVLHNLLYVQHFCSNCDRFEHTELDESLVVNRVNGLVMPDAPQNNLLRMPFLHYHWW